MSKQYDVSLPITGILLVTVEAESEDDAIRKAFESDQLIIDNIEEWDVHEKIVEGNILYASHNNAYAELAFGEEEE